MVPDGYTNENLPISAGTSLAPVPLVSTQHRAPRVLLVLLFFALFILFVALFIALLFLLKYLVGYLKGDGVVVAAFVVFLRFIGVIDSSFASAFASAFGGGG